MNCLRFVIENNKLNLVNKKPLKYKIFIAGNLLFSSYLLLSGLYHC